MPHHTFKKNFIKEAIFRLDFSEPVTDKIHKKLKDRLGISADMYSEENIEESNIYVEGKRKARLTTKIVGTQAIYQLANGRVTLTHESLIVVVNTYESFGVFSKLIIELLDSFEGLVKHDIEYQRVGMRYINRIQVQKVSKNDDWMNFIEPTFRCDYAKLGTIDGLSVRRSMTTNYFSSGDFIVKLISGIWNESYPGLIKDHSFIIDIDCFIESMKVDGTYVKQNLQRMNDFAVTLFLSAASKKLQDLMRKSS